MAELLLRVGSGDAALLRLVFGEVAGGRVPPWRPHRIVTDAHVAAGKPEIADSARRAGVPLVIDPQTHFLQDVQHPADPWARLAFTDAARHTPDDLSALARQDRLIAESIEFQLAHGATVLIPPYVHIERVNDGWVTVQTSLWQRTRRYLDQQDLHLPVLAVLALGWRLLNHVTWPSALYPLRQALTDLNPAEVALAASKIDDGVRPDQRLVTFIVTLRRIRRRFPLIAWNQGMLGEAAVAAGAVGYETGLGWRERCDLRATMAAHRQPPSGGFSARPVYIPTLKRSIPKRTIQQLMAHPNIIAELACLDSTCCPDGPHALLGDARAHALAQRVQTLHELTQPRQPAWKWNILAQQTAAGLHLAQRINVLADRTPDMWKINTAALHAIHVVAENRRQTLGRHRAA